MLTLKQKVAVTNVINSYRRAFRLYNVDSKGNVKDIGSPLLIYINNPKALRLILKKLYRKIKVNKNRISGESRNAKGEFRRFTIKSTGQFYSTAWVYGCCYSYKTCKHYQRLCNGDTSNGWKYHVGSLTSIEDFLTSSIGFCNSFDLHKN